ncbi:multidrug efflux pump [Rhodovulum sulfidophilum]|uniref:efflux RND transporter permease subunit n=1 Tax=Rhodovulum sulfidophilum TaxID=35806 RepID=UPI0005A77160|nr:efflux RND transporter permease subunit [Rhodovulum sulfidophilum]ANB34045.1 acriflavine resistance protein B [Rhodovulum sulfidophilum DSM 1374]ANB37867.1 acriflavine resistance protein B [Rhodovulum sulfidophilum]MCW2304157.1 multidrug efflux pump [Rhodovulum sulfidophilum]
MTGLVDWAAARARMVVAFVLMSLVAGALAYIELPKEGEPDIEIPALFISVPFPGISAEDSERLLIKPMETELSDLDGLDKMSATASENYAGIALEFEFGWDKTKIIADVRDRMNKAEADFPSGYETYTISEINFSEFPILVVNLAGTLPERTLVRTAKDLQDRLEALDPVLEVSMAGQRDEMLEVILDPLKLESYNVTAQELVNVVTANNQLIAADEIETAQGAFALKIPASFESPEDVYDLPVKVNGNRVVRLGDLAEIRLTFEDRSSTARFNGEQTLALQVVKRKGFNIIDTSRLVREEVEKARAEWPPELRQAIVVTTSNDQSTNVESMVRQLEGSVLTAIALVMVVVLAFLGTRSALLVGFAIPTSFLLCFVLLAILDVTVSNIVMFGLILAVGMLVDGAIVVVEYADRRIAEGTGPMHAFAESAKRMFWPIVSSTATTLCAFLPMLFWPGIAGEFMGLLPVTLIFVLSASLVVALVYLPVVGGVAGRFSRLLSRISARLRPRPRPLRIGVMALAMATAFFGLMRMLNPSYPASGPASSGPLEMLPGMALFTLGLIGCSLAANALRRERPEPVEVGHSPTLFGRLIRAIAGNPVMPLVTVAVVGAFVAGVFFYYGKHNNGVEFFVKTEPEQAIVYVRARGNLSIDEKDAMVREVERIVLAEPGVENVFAFAGDGGLSQNTGGASPPLDTVGQVQIELQKWRERAGNPDLNGALILERIERKLEKIPGIRTEILNLADGPASAKPVHLRLKGDDWDDLAAATQTVLDRFEETEGLRDIEDTRPLPGIDWQIDVDTEEAGRFGASAALAGQMVQLVTRGVLLDTMRVPSSDEEIDIRVRLPERDRLLSTLDTLKVRTEFGLVPLSNFVTISPVRKIGRIDRVDGKRYFDVKAAVTDGLTTADGQPINANERIATLTRWLETASFPQGVSWEWTGDQENQEESTAFLSKAFTAALGLMFIILLAQFNSFYNSVLVLLAVVLSSAGVLIGMLVMGQPFSIIMTGTGVVALAGIVVNNNIVLIDTYQDYARYMPRIEAIVRTCEDRIRPVFLTTVTTMAGLLSMMLGVSFDFANGGYTMGSPASLWWTQLATAVVFGLGVATVLTLVFTPSLLALREWVRAGAYGSLRRLAALSAGPGSRAARDLALNRAAGQLDLPEIVWSEPSGPTPPGQAAEDSKDGDGKGLRAAE